MLSLRISRVLVTGASGYVGRHVLNGLLEAGIDVRGFARRPQPTDLLRVEWRQGDIRHLGEVIQAARGCDGVVHLASLPLVESWQDPQADFEVNAQGTLNVLQAARVTGLNRVVYTSTAQVYGFPKHLPVAESAPPRPASPYAASKLCGEILCETFARAYGIGTMILRLFNVYGPSVDGEQRQTVEAIFARRVARGLPPVIEGNPEEGRDFIYVGDVVRGILLALSLDMTGQTLNIGSGQMTTLLELAQLVIEVGRAKTTPLIEGNLSQPAMRLQADMRQAWQVLGFRPQTSLRNGLARMIIDESH